MKNKNIYLIIALIITVSPAAWTSYGNMIFRVKNNPTTLGMANAVAGVENGETACEFNPAALIGSLGKSASLSYAAWPEGIVFQQLLSSYRLNPKNVIGVSINSFQTGEISSYDNQGNLQPGKYNNGTMAVGMSYARKMDIFRITGAGVTLRYVSEKLENETSKNMLADAGLMFKIENNDKSRFGIAIRNMGTKPKFFTEEDTPMTVAYGFSRWFTKDENLLVAVSGEKAAGAKDYYGAGGEYRVSISPKLFGLIRAGYTTERKDLGTDAGITTGLGITWDNMGINVAWRPSLMMGDISTMEFKYIFSPSFGGNVNRYAKVKEYENLERDRKAINEEIKIRYTQRYSDAMSERDNAMYTQGVSEIDVNNVDQFRIMAEDAAKKGNFDQAWSFINQSTLKYRDLYVKASAKKMLEEFMKEKRESEPTAPVSVEKPAAPTVRKEESLYQNGLQSYIKGDMKNAIGYYEKYLNTNDNKYRNKVMKHCANAYCKQGYEKFMDGDTTEASRMWRRGHELDDTNEIINKYINEYVSVKCDELFQKGFIAYSKGNIEDANKCWNECIKLDPNYERALKALAHTQ
ncbi:MAG: PorV/PorQ family protein [Elusimicrobiota bacterium]